MKAFTASSLGAIVLCCLAYVPALADEAGSPTEYSRYHDGGTVGRLLALNLEMQADEAEPEGNQDEQLAKATQNPVADLISVPFQNNFNFDVGPDDDMQYILNIQPVIPFSLNEDWNLITRTIVPYIRQPEVFPGSGREAGLGDINLTCFLSPAESGKVIWGVGPIVSFPTASDELLGTEKWSAGPSAVVLSMNGPWVYGALINNVWSFAGKDSRRDVSQMLLQPFLNYNMEGGWYLSSSPIITANWKADGGNTWTVPLGGGIGKIVRIGKLPVNMQLQGFYYVESPDGGPDWAIRFQFQFLFPK